VVGPRDLTLRRRIDISSRRDGAPGGGGCRTGRDRAAVMHVSVGLESRRLLSNVVPGRNLKNRNADCKRIPGFLFSRFAPARKSAQIISSQYPRNLSDPSISAAVSIAGFVPQLESLAWLEVCRLPCADGMFADMAVRVEVHHTGDPETRAEVVAVIEHVLADRAGDWLVSIIGSQANDGWQMKIAGPNGFERSYTLEGTAGEHRPEVIRVIVGKMVAANL
jgi:hypothetical protein